MKKENTIDLVRTLVEAINALPPKDRTVFFFDKVEEELKKLKVGDGDSVYGLIYITNDLTQFKDIDGNRIINENSKYIEKLADSIRLYGVNNPVLVNETFGVADGQRRITAIRRHGLPNPVPYFRRKGADIEVVTEMNKNNEKWGWKDYLHRWVTDNREDYVEYKDRWAKWEWLMKARSLRGLLMVKRVDPLPSDVWERGQFHIDKENSSIVEAYLKILEKTSIIGDKDNIFSKDRNFQKALYDMFVTTKKLDVDRLLVKLRTFFMQINVRYDYKTYKKILAEIYNRRLPGSQHHVIGEDPDGNDNPKDESGKLEFTKA